MDELPLQPDRGPARQAQPRRRMNNPSTLLTHAQLGECNAFSLKRRRRDRLVTLAKLHQHLQPREQELRMGPHLPEEYKTRSATHMTSLPTFVSFHQNQAIVSSFPSRDSFKTVRAPVEGTSSYGVDLDGTCQTTES